MSFLFVGEAPIGMELTIGSSTIGGEGIAEKLGDGGDGVHERLIIGAKIGAVMAEISGCGTGAKTGLGNWPWFRNRKWLWKRIGF